MLSTSTATARSKVAPAPVELHYWLKEDIAAGVETKSLCGEIAVPVKNSYGSTTGTSYTCPDCMLRYSMLPGDDDA